MVIIGIIEVICFFDIRDHKPSDKDEANRIKKNNGRISAFQYPNGDYGGPLRIWMAEEQVPGLAVTRSFG